MSTPMRHGPSQQGRTPSQHPAAAPTPQASTPFSNPQTMAAFSPHGPRSSPQQFKKSPATATSATMANHSSNPPVNFDSPSAAAALGALGINDLNLDNISVGGLVGHAGRTDEEDRKKRMEDVTDVLLSYNSSRVSNQGLERLAIRLGLECLWEDVKGAGDNAKTLIIAGQTMGVEVGINNHIVHHVALAYNDSVPSLDKHVDKASAILLKNLALAPGQSPLTKKLTDFRANLERLATLDRLSVLPGLSCHEAIAGMWESLEKLHRWDVEKLRGDPALRNVPEERLRLFALCTRHGCPLMHTRGRTGLSLDYWKEWRKLASTTVDTEDAKTWGILIECAPASGMVFQPVRVSDKWIGPNIEKANITDEEMISATGPVLDWLEPANTLLPPPEDVKTESGLEGGVSLRGPKPPDVVFLATFDPPVVVPHAVATEIYKITATNMPLSSITFDALMFPIVDGSSYDPSEPREITYTQTVVNLENINRGQTESVLKAHRNTLFIYKPVYGQILSQVPFSHPKDLITMLPLLRQYAFLSLLLTNSLKPKEGQVTAPEADAENAKEPSTTTDEFDRFMDQANAGKGASASSSNMLKVDITLTAHPVPRLSLVFPFKTHTANVMLEIQLGGKVCIVSDNIFPTPTEPGAEDADAVARGKGRRQLTLADWASALETAEDIGVWIEYIKYRLE
ncbi:mediator of RNA polymerase II transcription subunit 1-domain-containing protein [Xylariaceae sp. FL0662B]|nr:mediator of RNA polymerase II transcription subunit 1-domain-containing protein [Xylariaceae sp. FL0662B]